MGYIHCCSAMHKCRTFEIKPSENYIKCELHYLEACPICNNTILQLIKISKDNEISIYRLKNKKARKFFEKIKDFILVEKTKNITNMGKYGKFYLNYNEYGKKKKCYSNLSSMKIGIFENFS